MKLRKRTSEFKEMKGFSQSQCFPTNQETLNNQRALNINYSTDIFIFDFCLLSYSNNNTQYDTQENNGRITNNTCASYLGGCG